MSRINSKTVLSGLLLCLSLGVSSSFAASPGAFHEGDIVVRWDRIVGVITAQGISNPVGGIASGTTPWTTTGGRAAIDLTTGEAKFVVEGLVLVGGNASGAPGPVNSVKGSLVCDAGAADQSVFDTPAVPLDAQGNAELDSHVPRHINRLLCPGSFCA